MFTIAGSVSDSDSESTRLGRVSKDVQHRSTFNVLNDIRYHRKKSVGIVLLMRMELVTNQADPTDTSYSKPRKCILSKEQLEAFQNSNAHKDIISYVETLNESVVGVKLSDECTESIVSK